MTALTAGAILSDRYEVLAPLGRGGMGVVYKAHDRELDDIVAVKVLRPETTGSAILARRLRTEIKLARRVRHPNVCAIHEYGQDGHFRFIVMEYIDGADLKRVLMNGIPLPEREAYGVALEIAAGLEAIHSVGILHRDLKTANIMRDHRGVIRLMDFGIAKNLDAMTSEPLTAAGYIVGTPGYMSPEQVRGEKLDVRSDVYSLGVVIHELFTGQLPFRGDTAATTLSRQLDEEFDPRSSLAQGMQPDLRNVLRTALARNRDVRFASVRDVIDGLRKSRREDDDRAKPVVFAPEPPPSGSIPEPPPRAVHDTPPGELRGRAPRTSPLILIVEDNEMNRDMLSRRLVRKGYEIVAALDGGEALARAVSEKPDLILMDMRLPGLNGWEASRRLKADPATRSIPIIALTAHTMVGDRERAQEAGCDDYDTKPVDLPRLLAKIDAHLKRIRAS